MSLNSISINVVDLHLHFDVRSLRVSNTQPTTSKMCAMPTAPLLASVAALTIVEVCGTAAVTRWAKNDEALFLVTGLFLFMLLGVVMAVSVRVVDHMNTVNALWQSFSIACVSILSFFCFGEIITPRQCLGVALAILASICFL